MDEEKDGVASADKEIYLIRQSGSEEHSPCWEPVDRSTFARHEGPSLSCLASSAKEEIAAQEGIPATMVSEPERWRSSKAWTIKVSKVEDLPEALRFVERTREPIDCHSGYGEFKKGLKGHTIVRDGSDGHVSVDRRWVFDTYHNLITYEPERALGIESSAKERAERATLDPPRNDIKIPYRVLVAMSAILEDRLREGVLFKKGIARIDVRHNVMKKYLAQTIVDIAKALGRPPRKGRLGWLWKYFIGETLRYAKDKSTPGSLGRLILKEARALRGRRLPSPKTSVRQYATSNHTHKWSKIEYMWGCFQRHCTAGLCSAAEVIR